MRLTRRLMLFHDVVCAAPQIAKRDHMHNQKRRGGALLELSNLSLLFHGGISCCLYMLMRTCDRGCVRSASGSHVCEGAFVSDCIICEVL